MTLEQQRAAMAFGHVQKVETAHRTSMARWRRSSRS